MDSNSHSLSAANPEHQVDLSRLFSDVSRAIGGIRQVLSSSISAAATSSQQQKQISGDDPIASAQSSLDAMPSSTGSPSSSESESSLPFAGLFGGSNVCFKTCGMEDIQFAARRAGEMFMTMKICLIVLTTIAVLSVLTLTSAALIYLYLKSRRAEGGGGGDGFVASATGCFFRPSGGGALGSGATSSSSSSCDGGNVHRNGKQNKAGRNGAATQIRHSHLDFGTQSPPPPPPPLFSTSSNSHSQTVMMASSTSPNTPFPALLNSCLGGGNTLDMNMSTDRCGGELLMNTGNGTGRRSNQQQQQCGIGEILLAKRIAAARTDH